MFFFVRNTFTKTLKISSMTKNVNFFSTDTIIPYKRAKKDDMLYESNISFLLKNKSINVKSIFLDSNPTGPNKGVLIAIHGSPGTHKDFKYLTPLLIKEDIRVIAVNFPGIKYTSSSKFYKNKEFERQNYLNAFIEQFDLNDKKLVVLSHSRGSVDGALLSERFLNYNYDLKGLIQLNYIGLRPHKALRPFCLIRLAGYFWQYESLRFMTGPLYSQIFNRLGFRIDGEEAGYAMQSLGAINYHRRKKLMETLNKKNLFIINAFSGSDSLNEPEIGRELAAKFDNNKELICDTDSDKEISEEIIKCIKNNEKHLSVCFQRENHYLQKSRATFLTNTIKALLET